MPGKSVEPGGNVVIPVEEQGEVHPTPIPEDHQPKTPEFLNKLFIELDGLRAERDKAYAKRYGQPQLMTKSGEHKSPPYKEVLQFRLEEDELDKKISALQAQINELLPMMSKTPGD